MNQEYEIADVRKGNEWESSFGKFQSYNLALLGHGEPVLLNKKVPVNQEPQVGDKLYGSIQTKTSRNNKTYYQFKTEKRPEGETRTMHDKEYQEGQAWGNALTNAVQSVIPFVGNEFEDLKSFRQAVVDTARFYFESRSASDTTQPEKPATQPQNAPQQQSAAQKRDWSKLGKDMSEPDDGYMDPDELNALFPD